MARYVFFGIKMYNLIGKGDEFSNFLKIKGLGIYFMYLGE